MNREEVKSLFKRIKVHYDKFSISQEKLDEWVKVLKDYRSDGVNLNFDNYIFDKHEEPPKAVSLINETIRTNVGNECIYCSYCKKRFSIERYKEYQEHLQRHNSIYYIKSREHLINKNFNQKDLEKMNESVFQNFYDLFIDEIVKVIEEPKEKKILNNCINSKNGKEIELDDSIYQTIGKKIKEGM